jgi:hypothetical protein
MHATVQRQEWGLLPGSRSRRDAYRKFAHDAQSGMVLRELRAVL